MDVWGERDAAGAHGITIVPAGRPAFVIPCHIEHEPQFETIEGQSVENPAKIASFRAEDWWARVPGRDPGDGDILITPDRKKWDIGATSVTTDGRFEVPLYEFRPR